MVPFRYVRVVWVSNLECVFTGLAGADADRLFHGGDEDFAVADFVGFGCGNDRFNSAINLIVGQDDLDFDLWQKIDLNGLMIASIFFIACDSPFMFLMGQTISLAQRQFNGEICGEAKR